MAGGEPVAVSLTSSEPACAGGGARAYGGVLFVNCGSLGKPKDSDPRGAFAILTEGRVVTIERVDNDAEAVADEVAAAGLPAELADKLVAET